MCWSNKGGLIMKLFELNGKNAVVMGGGGVLGTDIAKGLVKCWSKCCHL